MRKKIATKKLTLEDLSVQIDTRIRETNDNMNARIDNLRQHVDKGFEAVHRQFEEQTEEFSGQITDVLELVDNRLRLMGKNRVRT